ncbi:MAG: DUF177 domain-containing protein [Bdellovibrionales bacterium]|nr:DUF177 domain-containing protein [Bdellovibrionales bacterium]
MKVYFHEIKDQELVYQFDESTSWVMEVVGALDERIDRIQRPPGWKPRSRPTQISFTLRRVDDLVHVSGKVKSQLFLLCSLCADPFHFPVNLQFHSMLTQSEMYAEAPRETSRKGSLHENPLKDNDEDDDSDLGPMTDFSASDFEVTVVKEPFANLKEILSEQIMLTIPMQPKPDMNGKGDCVKCGKPQAALQTKITESSGPLKENPFAVLKDYNKKKH